MWKCIRVRGSWFQPALNRSATFLGKYDLALAALTHYTLHHVHMEPTLLSCSLEAYAKQLLALAERRAQSTEMRVLSLTALNRAGDSEDEDVSSLSISGGSSNGSGAVMTRGYSFTACRV